MKKIDQEGQALIELIIFLPLIFTLYGLIGGFANAINGSINQQKITRAYFYYRTQNNSTIPKPLQVPNFQNWRRFGLVFTGWSDEPISDSTPAPVAPCYEISFPVAGAPNDRCENQYATKTTQFIRVGTAYGICGASYITVNGRASGAMDVNRNVSNVIVDQQACIIE